LVILLFLVHQVKKILIFPYYNLNKAIYIKCTFLLIRVPGR